MSLTYFLIDILTLAGPLILSFDKKVAFASKWKYFLPAILIPAFIYILWDTIFVRLGIWKFNPEFLSSGRILKLPWEEILFFICIPYACLFIYECLRVYSPGTGSKVVAIIFGWILVLVCVAAIFFYWDRIYTAVTALLLMVTLINHLTATRGNYLSHVFISWGIALIPMAIVNGLLTALPILIYDDTNNSGIRLGTIPIEDFFYNLLFMLWMIWIFEYFRQKPMHKAAAQAKVNY
ncbi:MAG: lycopene cyclase domain-containing protein [Bacteroidetes bacterium]|nr:lycopene cyclase domain-containing protein [Bacteroidota bacterium]